MIFSTVFGERGDWLVFVHGLTCDHTDWQKQVEFFSDRYRCLCVDLRGHGRSSDLPGPYDPSTLGQDVAEVMRARDAQRAVLIGHSMGTRVVVEALHAAPDRVKGIVFVDGSKQGHGDPQAARDLILARIDSVGFENQMSTMFQAMFTERSDPIERAVIVARARATPERVGRELMSEMALYDAGKMESAYGRIAVPMLVLQSTTVNEARERRLLTAADSSTPYLDMIKRLVPAAHIELVQEVGHFTQLDAAQVTNRGITRLAEQAFAA
ncbi:MAG: alpha/beta hydrolase [Gammaproteobacteria bacterium]|nr:alpha/beta hydrolase [Gammaproteobacteria bacterium]